MTPMGRQLGGPPSMIASHPFSFRSHILPVLLPVSLALLPPARGAAVLIDSFAITWENPAGSNTVESSATLTLDLSESIGFTAGQPIEITFAPDPGLGWSGFFRSTNNRVCAFTWKGTVEITAGAHSMTYTEAWGLPDAGSAAGANRSSTNSDGVPHSFIVPWGTDLTAVTMKLTDESSVSGTNSPLYYTSSMKLAGLLTSHSVPGHPPGFLQLSASLR